MKKRSLPPSLSFPSSSGDPSRPPSTLPPFPCPRVLPHAHIFVFYPKSTQQQAAAIAELIRVHVNWRYRRVEGWRVGQRRSRVTPHLYNFRTFTFYIHCQFPTSFPPSCHPLSTLESQLHTLSPPHPAQLQLPRERWGRHHGRWWRQSGRWHGGLWHGRYLHSGRWGHRGRGWCLLCHHTPLPIHCPPPTGAFGSTCMLQDITKTTRS